MALYFPVLRCMALFALIPPFSDSPTSKISFARLSFICFMVSSNTALYTIVRINTDFSLSSAFKNVLDLVAVWIVRWYWKLLRCEAMYLSRLLDFWTSAFKVIFGSVRVWQQHQYRSALQCMALYLLIPGFLAPAALEIFGLISVRLIYRYSGIPDCLALYLSVLSLQLTYDNTMSSVPSKWACNLKYWQVLANSWLYCICQKQYYKRLIEFSFSTFQPAWWSGSVLCNHPCQYVLQLQFYLRAWQMTSYAKLCTTVEPHAVTPLYILQQSLRLSKCVYIHFHPNTMYPIMITCHLSSVDARCWLKQSVHHMCSLDPCDQDYLVFDARLQRFCDDDDGDSDSEESWGNSNNIYVT